MSIQKYLYVLRVLFIETNVYEVYIFCHVVYHVTSTNEEMVCVVR